MTAESFVELIREGQAPEEGIKKHMGVYRTKDVEQYVEKLHTRIRNMETVFQERFEEMRTGLIAMTRERDEQLEKVRALEEKLMNIPEQCEIYIENQGLVTVPKDQYDRMQKLETNLRAEIANLSKKQALIEQENVHLIKELEKSKQIRAEADKMNEELEKLRIRIQDYDTANEELSRALQVQSDQCAQLILKSESLEAENFKLSEELKQSQARYKSLELQHQLAQKTAQQLMQDKEQQDKKLQKLQTRFDAERSMLISRYKGILADQQHCLQRLKDNFLMTMDCINSMAETEIKIKEESVYNPKCGSCGYC